MKKFSLLIIALVIALSPITTQAISIGCWNTWPTIGLKFNEQLTGYVGYNFYGNYQNKATNWFLVKLDYNIVKLGEVQTKAGVDYYWSAPNFDSALEFTYGASIMLLKNLSVGFDIMLLRFRNGPTSTDILPGANLTANLYF